MSLVQVLHRTEINIGSKEYKGRGKRFCLPLFVFRHAMMAGIEYRVF